MNTSSLSSTQRLDVKNSNRQNFMEHSPESDQFKKYSAVLTKYNPSSHDKGVTEADLITALTHMKDLSKKTKYQLKILDLQMIQKIFIPIMYSKENMDYNVISAKIVLNVAKNKNHHYKLIPEDAIMKEILNLLIIYLNSNLTTYILKILFHLTENKEFLNKVKRVDEETRDTGTLLFERDKKDRDIRSLKKVDLPGFTRVFVEKILDDLSSSNKNLLLKTIYNIYYYNNNCLHIESIEPIIRCLGDKENDTIVSGLNIILMYAKDKNFHQQLINTNFIFRLVRIYKQGIVEMDTILVQILLIFFENTSLHDLLFESKIVFILENYLNSFDNDQNEEVLRNVLEIFKEIIKISDKDIDGGFNKNPIKDDLRLQMTIFTKALRLASSTKKEKSILSCLSTINLMLEKYSFNLLKDDDHLRKIIELMPMFFKSKDLEILKFSLSIFEAVLASKQDYFQENYVKSNDKSFNIKSLVHIVINQINEFFTNFGVVSKSCNILIQLSDISLLHNFFLQEPQITVLRVFNDDLIKEKIKLIKDLEKIFTKTTKTLKPKLTIFYKESDKNTFDSLKKDYSKKESFSSMEISPRRSNNNLKIKSEKKMSKANKEEIIKKEEEAKKEIEKKILENKEVLKSSVQVIANLTKYSENLETLTNKGFLDIINKMLINHNLDALPQIVKCIQGFCGASASINIILNHEMIKKILKLFKQFRDNSPMFGDKALGSNMFLTKNFGNNQSTVQFNEENLIYEKAASKLEVLICIRNIVESDIKIQRQFIIDEGIHTLLCDVTDKGNRISEKSIDQLNAMILKVLYVISCNINKLFVVFNKGDLQLDDFFNEASVKEEINESNSFSSSKNSELEGEDHDSRRILLFQKTILSSDDSDMSMKYFDTFKKQLSKGIFMEKLLSIGYFEITSIQTYKELINILINLYLNRYYLKYFTSDPVFEKVMAIIEKILTKYMQTNENNYDIIKLILIFLKFICEEENLIKKFLDSSVISNILNIINTNEFKETIEKQELGQFYYNTSLVILRLTEFKGHTDKFDFMKNLFNIIESLYEINLMNGKIYIISIIKNILSEKDDFFQENDIVRFINKIVSQGNNFIIYEFVELLKILVHSRNICKRMENVFKYLISEIKSSTYSHKFKKKILELILCLSYENTNIKDFALHDLLILIKNLDININKKTTLLILMNFSSVSSNFSYLLLNANKNININKSELNDSTQHMLEKVDGMTIKKKDLIGIINHLLDSDRFSQILIQRLLINITSIQNIDLSIISEKIINLLIEIISTNKNMQESIIIFSLAVMINVSNRNMLKVELNKQDESVLDKFNENNINNSDRSNKSDNSDDDKIIKNEIKKKSKKKKGINNKKVNYNKKEKKKNEKTEKNEKNDSINDSLIDQYNNITKTVFNDEKEKMQDIHIVDYILSMMPNIIQIINDLFERENMDIASLTIMFACNISRKIKLSSFFELEGQITNCIDDYFFKNYSKSVLETDSGKFFVIAIIKYCICLSSDERKVKDHKRLFVNIINLLIDEDNNLIMIDLNKQDIICNNIKFVLAESKMKFLNILLEISKDLNIFENLNINNLISSFYAEFIKKLSVLLTPDDNNKIELHSNLQDLILASFHILTILIKNNFDYDSISNSVHKIIITLITFEPSKFSENLKSLFVFMIYNIINGFFDKNELSTNYDLLSWLINLFKITSNSIQTDYYSIKLFLKSVSNMKFSDIFWKSNKFIKKLFSYSAKSNPDDEKSLIMKKETEKILNMISFNQNSHKRLHEIGIYNYYKNNLYSKFIPGKNNIFSKDDVIFLANIIINKDNYEFVKDDIISLLKSIFLCKDLVNTIKIELFEIFVTYSLEHKIVKIFKEDYLIIFNLLYDNLRENFSDMIILVDNFTKKKKYEHFCKMLVTDDNIVTKIYQDFLNFDSDFPSQFEELNCFFKILELFINHNISDKIEETIFNMMEKIIKNKYALKDINIVNTILGFILFFYSQVVESDKTKNTDEELIKFIQKYQYSELINIICKDALQSKEIANVYILSTMILQQEEYKSILKPLKKLNNFLFGKEFMTSFFGFMIDLNTLDIREFAYIINIAINLTSFGKIDCMEEFLKQIIDVYENFLLKRKKEKNDVELNDIITSLYYFCDLIKNTEINKILFQKTIKFIINVLTSISIIDEQKEILIKYYHEILKKFKITTSDDLNLIFSFFLKIHYDGVLNFIESVVMGTIITNTVNEIITKNTDAFIQMLILITSDVDENKLIEYLKFMKQLVLSIKNTTGNNASGLQELKLFFLKTNKKYDKEIKNNEIMKKKKEKLMIMMK